MQKLYALFGAFLALLASIAVNAGSIIIAPYQPKTPKCLTK